MIKAECLTDGQSLRCKGFIGFHQIEIIDGPACLLQSALRCWHRAYAHYGGIDTRMGPTRHASENRRVPSRGFICRRSEEHTSELQSLMRISYAVFCLKKKNNKTQYTTSS